MGVPGPDRTRSTIYAIQHLCVRLMLESPPSKAEITALVRKAQDAQHRLLTEEQAIREAEGFRFPSDITDKDLAIFKSLKWDFTALARQRISELNGDRISEDSIRRNIDPADPDLPRLLPKDVVVEIQAEMQLYVRLWDCISLCMTQGGKSVYQ